MTKAEENCLILCAGQGAYEGDALDDTQALADLLKDQGMPAHLEVWGGDVSRLVLVGQDVEPVCTAHSGSKVRAYNEESLRGFPRFYIQRFEWPPRALWPCSAEFHLLIYGPETPAAFPNHFCQLYYLYFISYLNCRILCAILLLQKIYPMGFMKGAIPIWKRPKALLLLR